MISIVVPTWSMSRALTYWGEYEDAHIVYRMGCVEGMANGAERCKGEILAFFHDDIEIHDHDWATTVSEFFSTHPRCGMVGFGGAYGLGLNTLYKKAYDYHQLARVGFVSNMTDAEVHGERVTTPQRVAVLDGFAQIIRREAYEQVGGWLSVLKLGITFHMYDIAMACLMRRPRPHCPTPNGWEVWMLPISVTHHGGRTSTTPEYDQWLKKKGVMGDSEVHQKAHVVVYKEFKDVLPFHV